MPPPDAAPPLNLEWSGYTDVGRFRQNNEDAFLALAFDGTDVRYLGKTGAASQQDNDFVFAVSDGMGGAAAGEFASKITVEKVTRLLPRSFRQGATGMAAGFTDVLLELFSEVHRALLYLGQSYEECAGMGATLSLGWMTPGWFYFGHVGDSRIYYLPASGGAKQVTADHTRPGWLRRRGEINEREARNHPAKNILQQTLGARNQFLDPQIGAVGVEPGDRFLICSDGLVDGLWDHRIEELLVTDPVETLAQRLVTEAVEASGRDNVTAVVVSAQA